MAASRDWARCDKSCEGEGQRHRRWLFFAVFCSEITPSEIAFLAEILCCERFGKDK